MTRIKSSMTKIALMTTGALATLTIASLTFVNLSKPVMAHGDVTPQAVDTAGLPDLGDEWLEENPWRSPSNENWAKALEIGASGFNQNCARCHGLEVISGGIAPDLRFLEADIDGDEWFLERFKLGYTQNGITKMPAFGDLLGQEAAWAIRTYIETRPDDGATDEFVDRLKEIHAQIDAMAASGKTAQEQEAETAKLRSELEEIGLKIKTASGAPLADSVASRAAAALDGSPESYKNAGEVLTVGMSAAE